MLSNHDSFAGERAYNQFGGNLAQYRLAAATYLLQPGTPFIYYGEEVGMAGGGFAGGDPKLRTPMSWTASTANAGFTTGTPYRSLSANVAASMSPRSRPTRTRCWPSTRPCWRCARPARRWPPAATTTWW
jgi:glycosidase